MLNTFIIDRAFMIFRKTIITLLIQRHAWKKIFRLNPKGMCVYKENLPLDVHVYKYLP